MTTKIQFKLSNDILLTVIQMVEQTDDYVVQSIKDALLVSIKEDLIAKLEDKAKNIQKQISILDHNKKHAIVLKYHEAYSMYKLLELVYEKETFADHPHIKKIKRLLVDLENKVESFATDKQEGHLAHTETTVHPNFGLGVNEIIIEEATILDSEVGGYMEEEEDENNPVLDPSIDINEIAVTYSIFDILEENEPTDVFVDEIETIATEVRLSDVEEEQAALQEELNTTLITTTPEVTLLSTETALENTPMDERTEAVLDSAVDATETATEELDVATAVQIADEIIEAEPKKETAEIAIEELSVSIEDKLDSNPEEALAQEEEEQQLVTEPTETSTAPSWSQQPTPPIFDGVVTKTSICVESDLPVQHTQEEEVLHEEEETLHLFETDAIVSIPQEEKIEKETKREKKKPAKDNTQGQISLF